MPVEVGSLLHSSSVLGVTPGFGFLTRLQSVLPTDLVLVDTLDTNPASPICHVLVKWFRNLESNRPDFISLLLKRQRSIMADSTVSQLFTHYPF